MSKRKLIPLLVYILFLLVPIYWLLNMSFKSNTEILGGLTLFPEFHFRQLQGDLHRPELVHRLPQLGVLRQHEHNHFPDRGVAGGLCVFALSLPR